MIDNPKNIATQTEVNLIDTPASLKELDALMDGFKMLDPVIVGIRYGGKVCEEWILSIAREEEKEVDDGVAAVSRFYGVSVVKDARLKDGEIRINDSMGKEYGFNIKKDEK